jgi:PTS system nitrogen regulatory IIA component
MTNENSRIAAWLQPIDILLDVRIRDRQHAIEILSEAVGHAHGLDPVPVFRALWRRELAGTTAMGDGFAIPHARINGIERPMTLFVCATPGIDFRAPDGKPVSHLLGIVAPIGGAKDEHLQLLALVARLFSDCGFRKLLDRAPDVATAMEVFRSRVAQETAVLS